ncbi:hypothetical protein LI328DRAFT_166834 [Trichoderma asperelloides]|nr:hypothetical protein LI328DRAFT_166834 [Trichoderma asperelloides]
MARISRPQPAAYGAACTNCSKAKCRCVCRGQGGSCERCQRLKLECCPVSAAGRRNLRKSAFPRDRLEGKIDSLVSLLTSGKERSTLASTGQISQGSGAPPYDGFAQQQQQQQQPKSCAPLITDCNTGPELSPEPSEEEAEEYLRIFQTWRLKYFPFIHISCKTSAAELRHEKPFLWLCIMAVSTKSPIRQAGLYNIVRKSLADRMVLNLEKSLDLLLGLLCCLSWGNLQVQLRPFTSLFTQLAVSLIFDLGLNKTPPKDVHAQSDYRFHKSQVRPVRSMEERRAVLGCFVASSVSNLHMQRIDPLLWTVHMDECLQRLTDFPECTGDTILAYLVRSQLILQKAPLSPWRTSVAGENESAPAAETMMLYRKTLLRELDEARQKVPMELRQNDAILLTFYHTELSIQESTLSPHMAPLSACPSFGRIDGLCACLSAAKSWFDVFLAISPAEYVGFPFAMYSHLRNCAVALYKILALEESPWDRASILGIVDISTIMDRSAQNLEQVRVIGGLEHSESEEDLFTKLARRIRIINHKCVDGLRADTSRVGHNPIATVVPHDKSSDISATDEPVFSLPDDSCIMDMLGFGDW